jgi:hypothetical protein
VLFRSVEARKKCKAILAEPKEIIHILKRSQQHAQRTELSRKSSLLTIGFAFLALAFILCFSLSIGVFRGEDYHVIAVLEALPESLLSMLLSVALVGVAPILAGLAVHVVAHLKGSYAEIAGLQSVLVLIVGGFSLIWGYMYSAASYITHYDAVSLASNWHIASIEGYLLQFYLAYRIVGALWLVLAAFLVAVSITNVRGSLRCLEVLHVPGKVL